MLKMKHVDAGDEDGNVVEGNVVEGGHVMHSTFANDGSDAIERVIEDIEPESLVSAINNHGIEAFFEIHRCLEVLANEKYNKIALQFPDELLSHSIQVANKLRDGLKKDVFILADTTYGSCCVDEVAAEHINADVIVHYGFSCLSRTSRIPALYVFGHYPIDASVLNETIHKLVEATPETKYHIIFDVRYQHVESEVKSEFGSTENIDVAEIDPIFYTDDVVPPVTDTVEDDFISDIGDGKEEIDMMRFGRQLGGLTPQSAEVHQFIFVGDQTSRLLTNFMMFYSQSTFQVFDPSRGRLQATASIGRQLSRRYFLVQKAKDATTVGLLLGTLGSAHYGKITQMLQTMLKASGKKVYTLVVGKINPAKLANFTEMDIYCLVSCPHNSLVDSTEFFRPVLTPYELQLACAPGHEWNGHFESDYVHLMGELTSDLRNMMKEETEHGGEEAEPHFSLITSSYVDHRKNKQELVEDESGTIVVREKGVLAQYGGGYLQTRTFQGLEQKLGETPVAKAVEGRCGIAIQYEEEPTLASDMNDLVEKKIEQNDKSNADVAYGEQEDEENDDEENDDDEDGYLEEDFGNLRL
eukprot:m.77191 g.77191  ORF g.77191 m.77191 type:complete len:583 (+) comp8536_c0_seq2:48-1796(+)